MESLTAAGNSQIDWLLERLEAHWAEAERARSEWVSWEEVDRLDFVLEWPIAESHWEILQQECARTPVTGAQERRLATLIATMESLRPDLIEILQGTRDATISKPAEPVASGSKIAEP